MRGSGADAKSFFMQLLSYKLLRARNGLTFTSEEEPGRGLLPGVVYRQAANTWGMGNINSASVAELMVLESLWAGGAADKTKIMHYGHPLPESDLLIGPYLDDLGVMLVTDLARISASAGPDRDEMQRCIAAVTASGLAMSPPKGFGYGQSVLDCIDELHADPDFVLWGTEGEGIIGKNGSPKLKRLSLMHITGIVISLGRASKNLLRRHQALFNHPFLHRREMLCVFHRFYKFLESMPARGFVKLPCDIRAELGVAALLLPLAVNDMRRVVSSRFACVDATPSSGGACGCEISRELVMALFRSTEYKGSHVRLDGATPSPQVDPKQRMDPVACEIISCLPFETSRVVVYASSRHVNVRELHEVHEEIEYQTL